MTNPKNVRATADFLGSTCPADDLWEDFLAQTGYAGRFDKSTVDLLKFTYYCGAISTYNGLMLALRDPQLAASFSANFKQDLENYFKRRSN